MGLKLSQIPESKSDFFKAQDTKGLSLSILQSKSKKINVFSYINNSLTDVSDGYVIDLETYILNSRIRLIQLLDIQSKIIHLFVNGSVDDVSKIHNDSDLKKCGFEVVFHIYNESNITDNYPGKLIKKGTELNDLHERMMFYDFIEFLKSKPKLILGHNFAHFDIGIIGSLIQEFGIKGFKIFEYTVGSARGERRVAFSYSVTDNIYENWWNDSKRYNIIDSLMIAQSLGLESISLKELSKDTRFQKKDVDYRVFENSLLSYDSLIYGIYDVIAVPEVLKNLRDIWKIALKHLSIDFMQSQRIPEHVLMKGVGAIAEAFLNNLMDGQVSIETRDHLSKYFGGVTRAWDTNLHVSTENQKIRYLDFTSFYPFSVRKQRIFDVLNGDFKMYSNVKFSDVKDQYDDMLYSAVFEIKAKSKTRVIIEGELEKTKMDHLGVGFFRSFDKNKRIADLEHQFVMVVLNRGDKIKLTKTEYEITKALIDSDIYIQKVIDAIVPTSSEKSEEYINLYAERNRLKKAGNKANVGYKVLLNASYGKLAESKGRWFNLSCASAITGFCRVSLLKTISYAKSIKVDVLYSDTDSLYAKGNIDRIHKIQEFANTLNEHPSRFGENNLKDEQEDIVCFWAIKRKRYLKVINQDGKNQVIIKGQNGNKDIRWRDVFFRLSCITDGETDIKKINKKIKNNEFKLSAPISKSNIHNVAYLNENIERLKKEMRKCRSQLSKKQQRWSDFYDYISNIMNSEESGEYLSDLEETTITFKSYFHKILKHFNIQNNLKDSNTFLYLFEKLKADYDNESLLILLSDIGNVDLSFLFQGYSNVENDISQELETTYKELKSATFDFELACRKLYQKHINERMSDLFPVKSNSIITMMMSVHFKKSTNYENGLYYQHIVKAWENETGRKAWIGCFFSMNRDYSFVDKDAQQIKDFNIQYLSYASKDDKIPIIHASKYNAILNREINLDTIRLKTREGINLKYLSSDDDKRDITKKIMSLKRTSQSSRVLDIFGSAYIFRLKIPEDLDYTKVEILKNKDEYSNSTLFLTGQFRIESAIRINKIRMFLKKRDIFSIYRFISKLGVFSQKLVLHLLDQKTTTNSGNVFSPIELNGFPRFTFVTQADVYQPVDKEYAKKVHDASFDSIFHNSKINHFWNFKLLSYCELNVYHKKRSAINKIKRYEMQDFERETFEYESQEGEYRSEIKFKLKRNYYETLSYVFALGNIDQEYFLNLVSSEDGSEFKHIRKHYEFNFPAKINGYYKFNQRKCVILFDAPNKTEVKCLFYQVLNDEYFSKVMTHLESTWDSNVCYPPNKENSDNKSYVIWEWEEDKVIKKEDIEDHELELMGFR